MKQHLAILEMHLQAFFGWLIMLGGLYLVFYRGFVRGSFLNAGLGLLTIIVGAAINQSAGD